MNLQGDGVTYNSISTVASQAQCWRTGMARVNDMCKLFEVTMDVERHSVDTSGSVSPSIISVLLLFFTLHMHVTISYDMILLWFDFRQL